MHFIPTSSSWLNMVERWFREITTQRIRRGSFRSVEQLEAAIQSFIDAHNEDPKPLVWTADLKDILPKIARAEVQWVVWGLFPRASESCNIWRR